MEQALQADLTMMSEHSKTFRRVGTYARELFGIAPIRTG